MEYNTTDLRRQERAMEEPAAHRLLAEGVVAVSAFQVESWKLEVLSSAGLRPRGGEKLDISKRPRLKRGRERSNRLRIIAGESPPNI